MVRAKEHVLGHVLLIVQQIALPIALMAVLEHVMQTVVGRAESLIVVQDVVTIVRAIVKDNVMAVQILVTTLVKGIVLVVANKVV